jgi:hypothetical protein
MSVQINNEEERVIKHALEVYLSNLRGEIVKTENHKWKEELHVEEDMVKDVVARFH